MTNSRIAVEALQLLMYGPKKLYKCSTVAADRRRGAASAPLARDREVTADRVCELWACCCPQPRRVPGRVPGTDTCRGRV